MHVEDFMTTPVDTVRSFYDALGRGDVSAVLSLLDAQVEWTEAERFPYYGGTWHGPQAVLDNLLVPLSGDWDGFTAQAHEFVAEGDRVVSLGIYTGTFKRTGRSFSAAFAHVWTVRGDKLARFVMHTDTAKVLEAVKS
jgi:ketosteroid isomerase-like protein